MGKREAFADISKILQMKCTHIQYFYIADIGKNKVHRAQ